LEKNLDNLKQENKKIMKFFRCLFRKGEDDDSSKKLKKQLKQYTVQVKSLQNDNQALSEDKNKLELALKDLQTENDNLKKESQEMMQRFSDLKKESQEMRQHISDLEAQLEKLKKGPLYQLKTLYLSLDEQTQKNLSRIFKYPEELSLFAAGILFMDALWDYAANLRNEHKDELFSILRKMIELLFKFYAPLGSLWIDRNPNRRTNISKRSQPPARY
jgi:DNA repair exonuclease SbcCD ATPase subunit